MLLGTQGPHRDPDPDRDLDRRAGGQMGARKKRSTARPALKKHVTGTPEETVGHQLGIIAKLIIWLVGIMAALQLPRRRRRSSRRSTSW